MTTEKDPRFLTCLEACDTIILLSSMDFNSILINAEDLCGAYAVVLKTPFSAVPDYWVESLAELKLAIKNVLGGGIHESIDGRSWAEILNV